MAQTQRASRHFSLVWGGSLGPHSASEIQAENLCQRFLELGVSGVFFAPFEITKARNEVNQRIVEAFDKAGIPVVLLDRDLEAYPRRSRYDLVGIDNRRAGYMLTQHLLEQGCTRIFFLARPGSASTVDARIMGYRDALFQYGLQCSVDDVKSMDPGDKEAIATIMRHEKPQAIICANDVTAMRLMQSLAANAYTVPDDLLVASFDDVKHAELLVVPLTTIHQPCMEIGAEAIAAMLERVARPELPARDILLDFSLVSRMSTARTNASSSRKKISR
ncbi:MAG: substrate-binding domain-containing protein [Edaphobacter sp.]|nr:substrate-binding domain-containing protein [Edaphobacter sp.]MDE1176395.1 substrate-binding domain-containing protein [Edaphobacter sp.]